MAKITYDNKETLNTQPSVADANKVTSNDMNEIKSVVNTNYGEVGDITTLTTTNKSSVVSAVNELKSGEIYSTTEVKTNKVWINGKPIYRTTFTITVGTSGGTASISGYPIETITQIIGTMKIQNQNQFRPIPVYGSNANYNPLEINIGNQISVGSSGGNFSIGTAYITLEYTKTTD